MIQRRWLLAVTGVAARAIGWYGRMLLFPYNPPVDARKHAPTHGAHAKVERKPMQQAFEDIYKNAVWGESADPTSEVKGTSGTGSNLESTLYWRMFLARFLKANHITSVVDAGCGDWEFSHTIDWTGIDYKGFDIVDSVVQADKKKYEAPNIHFFTQNMIESELPPADLLISKHVLQHLPNEAVAKFIPQFAKYKHVLIVNGVNPITLSSDNPDIVPGDYRDLDITAPPFDVAGARVLTYWDGFNMHQVVHIRGHQ